MNSGKLRPLANPRGRYIPDVVMPKFWFQRGSESDMKGIRARMSVIPKDKQQETANEYDRLFLSTNRHEGRRLANAYLHKLAMKITQGEAV